MGEIKIHNIRLGFATKSSSDHSIIICDSPSVMPSDEYLPARKGEYGSGEFNLTTKGPKLDYLARVLAQNLIGEFNEKTARAIIKSLFFVDLKEGGYVDHQSIFSWPCNPTNSKVDMDFARDFISWASRNPNVRIVGGSDGGDRIYIPKEEEYETINFNVSNTIYNNHNSYRIHPNLICRKDEVNNAWVLFNRSSGSKIRFSFLDKTGVNPTYKRGYLPELVDLKCTNRCSRGCAYCYMNSTPDGKEADVKIICKIIDSLALHKVFEISVGGGEPLEYPSFAVVAYEADKKNISVSTTTSADFDKLHPSIKGVLGRIRGIGVTVRCEGDIKNYEKYRDVNYNSCLQIVLGTITQEFFSHVLSYCDKTGCSLNILGYKHFGKGIEFKKKDYSWFINDLKKYLTMNDGRFYSSRFKVAVDSVLTAEFSNQLSKDLFVNDILFTPEDGAFSMFIDAVENRVAASSFSPEYVCFKDPKDLPVIIQRALPEIFGDFNSFAMKTIEEKIV